MSEPKYSVLLTDEQVNDLDLIQLVRQGKVKKAGGNGYIVYNEKWHNEHFGTEHRGRGKRLRVNLPHETYIGYLRPYCGHLEDRCYYKYCPHCGEKII